MEGFSASGKGLINPVILAFTFSAGAFVEADKGKFVKLSGNMSVAKSVATEVPFGQIVTLSKGSDMAGILVGGSFSATYSGSNPTVGVQSFLSDADGNLVLGAGGFVVTVLSVDTTAKTVDFIKSY